MRRLLDRLVQPFGLRVVRRRPAGPVYLHRYAGGYDEYRATQIQYNKRKLKNIWADETTLSAIADHIEARGPVASGICHGARNGFEVEWFRKRLGGEVVGTDISETALQFPHMHVWDFHDENPDWVDRFDFVYSNSLDQAMEPSRAVDVWARQIGPQGRIYVEHTMAHSVEYAGEMDPFGADPLTMPYLFFRWARGRYRLADILEIEAKKNNGMQAWIFVLARMKPGAEEAPCLTSAPTGQI